MNLKIMDVTIRESTYIENISLSEQNAMDIVKNLSHSNIDFIEIGYISKYNYKNIFKSCSVSLIDKLSNCLNNKSSLVLMLRPEEYDNQLLKYLINPRIGLLRLCISPNNITSSILLIKKLKKLNIPISANLTRISNLSFNEIITLSHLFQKAGADYLYLADSNGAMLPQEIEHIFNILNKEINLKLGFHPHDNLRTATVNTLNAIKNGATIIDASLYGYGKELANLPLQSFIALIKKMNLREDIDLNKIIKTANNLYNDKLSAGFSKYLNNRECNILTGYYNINLDFIKKLKIEANKRNINFIDILLDKSIL